MVRKFLIIVFIVGFGNLAMNAQVHTNDSIKPVQDIFSLLQDNSFGGDISFYQNPSLHVLIDRSTRLNKKNGLHGFRIQIYSGLGGQARDRAYQAVELFKEKFPFFNFESIYVDYQEPYFKVRIGDFRNKNEAYKFFGDVKNEFSGSYIVKSKINFPVIGTTENK